ncbi:MAG TPA: VIT domain-containing protein [Pyrinomonadaceae bacterium]|jgi:Ca-activated chloride channel family protein|nr:VIT domain-containing protein [Pyrinomonadaceae bacterium]
MRNIIYGVVLCLILASGISAQQITQGELDAIGKGGKALGACPLKNTDVQAEITGFLSRVKVTQEFENNFSEKIEAVYVFPLPQNAAVDDMTMRIGERVVRGKIMKREEAREVYDAAKANGQVASLLDQERANIFTQSIANILPGEKIVIEISYVETLKYEDGSYEFMFPMVVGPRYIPGSAIGKQGGGTAPDTTQVPDASKITPPIAPDRGGHDISIRVRLDAGVPVETVTSKSHQIESAALSTGSFDVKLKNDKTIPNKDFILRYDVAGKKIEDAVMTHRDGRGGYFTMILQPPDRVEAKDVTPKEIVFVLDTSGSMEGFPIEKAKESMKMALDGLYPQDTFNLITFAGDTYVLFEKPVPATPENLRAAQEFLATRKGGGGTEMMKAIKTALDPSDSQQHLRIVCFMTDGYVGNDLEIMSEIQKHPNARVFSFGIGSSVNRLLLDKMAEEGRGEVEYVSLSDDGSAAAKRFHERIRNPLLTDISIDFGGLKVEDVYPKRINDLFSTKPVIIHGRFTQPGTGVVKLKGRSFGRETVREIAVNFPENEPGHDVLATLWARTRIDDLMSQDYAGVQNGTAKPDVKNTITSLGLEYRLLTQFTSFVAVEETVVTDGGQPRRIEVPVELPEGVSREMVTSGADMTLNFTTSQLQELPINARRAQGLVALRPGVVNSGSGTMGKVKKKSEGSGRGSGAGVGVGASAADIGPRATPRSKNDPRNVKPELKAGYREWADKDVAYIVTGEEKQAFVSGIKATAMPKPQYPARLKAAGPEVVVKVEVMLDAAGNVTSAKAVSGDASLYKACEAAAMSAKFEIPNLGREILKITGTIIYDFTKERKVEAAEQLLEAQIQVKPNKYHSVIKALVDRLKANQAAAEGEAKFVANGKANIIVRVTELKPETIAALKAAGFEVVAEMASSNAVVGRIAIEKFAALDGIDAVVFISPQY